MKNLGLRHLFLLLLTVLSAHVGWSQGTTTAAMNGIITDKTGAGLPGATVIAVHTPTNTQYVAPTNSEGRFNIQNMRVGGPYTVRVTFIGYQEAVREGLFLTLGQNQRLDINLSESTQQLAGVTVEGRQNAIINSDRTGAATSIQREQIERLPTLSRSFDDFTRLTPQSNGQSFGGRNSGYNNITIDGALFNNAFGLSSTVGGQANAQPISLDAIEQIQVSLAPFDVRQGSFTGAGINAVTRSGTNKFSASVYGFYRDENFVGSKVGDVKSDYPKFDLKNYGFRVGGPIIKDKLFFFVNGEQERRNDPPTGNFVARQDGQTAGGNVSQASASELTALSNFLREKYNYNAGAYENYNLVSNSDKYTAKLDWNITPAHRFSVKYNYLKSYRDVPPSSSGLSLGGSRAQGITSLPFQAAYYRINNNLNSFIGELNSTFGSKASNNFTAGYTTFRDFRESSGGIFPLVDIGNGSGQLLTTFGYEAFSANNILNTDVFQIGDNYTMYLGKHNVTVGTYNEFYKFKNGFAPNYYGGYSFASLADFYSNANQTPNPATGSISNPTSYRLQYSATPDGAFPFADINAQQFGLYAQDEYTPQPNLKITLGIRADVPNIPTDIARNETAAGLSFRDGYKIETDKFQQTSVLFSPRVGVNWDVNNDQQTQLRGGTGIFTGRVPYVWISNQASNNGVLFGSFSSTNGANFPFSDDVTKYIPTNRSANTTYNLAVTDDNFKFPQVWRTNFAVDQQLPGGIVGTLEAIFTKDMNAVYHQNVNLPNSTVRAKGADNRVIYYFTDANGNIRNPSNSTAAPRDASGVLTGNYRPATVLNNRIYGPLVDQYGTELTRVDATTGFIAGSQANTAERPNITDAIVMKNSNKGYSYSATAQLRRSFSNGFYVDAAYTYSDARSVNDGGSIAQSIWRDRQISGDPNANVLSYSNFLQQHRVIASASYRKEYLNHLGTTISMFYTGAAANNNFGNSRFSYVYSGDMNGDGAGGNNDLIYVPRDRSEIVLNDIRFYSPNDTKRQTAVVTYSADQQWADLDAYINQDEYLKSRRGEYAERNGAKYPWQHRIDFRLLQDVFTELGQDNRNTLQLSVDIFNFGNMLNNKWGISQIQNRNALLTFANYNNEGKPTFTYPYLTAPTISAATLDASGNVTAPGSVTTIATPLSKSFRDDVGGLGSRWQMQVGLRYIFN